MPLSRLKSPAAAGRWLKSWVTGTLRTDSRALQPGDGFIAWPGHAADGRAYVGAALQAGAATCLVEETGAEAFAFDDARVATLKNMKAAAGHIAAEFFDDPSARLDVVATTGTNGKTSTAWWTAQALNLLGRRTGFVGTLGVGIPPLPHPVQGAPAQDWTVRSTGLTTPDPILLQASFRRMADDGFAAVAMEASSIGIVEHRMAGTRVDVALFTNFTLDHLDYHGSVDNYWAAKRLLFGWAGLKAAVVNLDDDQGALLAAELARGPLDLWTYSLEPEARARLLAEDIGYRNGGLVFTLVERDGHAEHRVPVATTLIGAYNASNLLAVLGGLRALGVPLARAAAVAGLVTPVPGRMQRVAAGLAGQPEVVVDYAHTPDALEKVIPALRPLAEARGGRLLCVFGCGGDRDASKRPLMGGIAARLADEVVVTSDNPRTEDPRRIVDQILAGATGGAPVRAVVDRRAAIAEVLAAAKPEDVVLIAGKGHEDYQEVGKERLPFSDVEEALAALVKRRLALPVGASPMMLELRIAADLIGADTQGVGNSEFLVQRVHTDSRSLRPGDLFVALKGERFDAHDFLPQVKAVGGVAALATHGLAEAGLDGLLVPDTLAALQKLATAWRGTFWIPTVLKSLIAVAGSNGKTTVTQMIASILRAAYGEAAHATAGNLNNHIGVPLTVLGLRARHKAAVVELGMNHPGEIAVLAAIAQPSVALVNNAQREHQEFMATVEAVARENGAAIEALADDGVAVFPLDDEHAGVWQAQAGARRCIRFALADDGAVAAPQAEVAARARWDDGVWHVEMLTPAGPASLALRVAGRHNVRNALAATAAALGAGVALADIVRGLEAFAPVKGRSQVKALVREGRRITLVDDTYNANPDSVRAAIDVLAGLPGPRWLVLGDMGEVGDQGPEFHREVGAYALQRGIEQFWGVGGACLHATQAYGPAARHFADTAALLAHLAAGRESEPAFGAVLVKGSRFMAMERVVAALAAHDDPATQGGPHAA